MKRWLQKFKWESKAQEEGFGAFRKWVKDLPIELTHAEYMLNCVVAFFIQKDHESNEWWRDTVGGQVHNLENQIALLIDRIAELERKSNGDGSL